MMARSPESPDLPPAHSVRLSQHHSQSHYEQPQPSHLPVFRFGSVSTSASSSAPSPVTSTPFTFDMSQHWNPGASASAAYSSYQSAHALDRLHGGGYASQHQPHQPQPHPAHQAHQLDATHSMTLAEEYDDGDADDLGDPSSGLGVLGMGPYGAGAGGMAGAGLLSAKANEKQIRRRSSKACDQCRKSKCKCERSSPQDPCRNCVMLGTRTSCVPNCSASFSLCVSRSLTRVLFTPLSLCLENFAIGGGRVSNWKRLRDFHPWAGATTILTFSAIGNWPSFVGACRVYLPRSVSQARPSQGLHRRHRGKAAPNRGSDWNPAR